MRFQVNPCSVVGSQNSKELHSWIASQDVPKTRPPNENARCTDWCWPQVDYLEQLMQQYPRSLFILNLRNSTDWVRSVSNWGKFRKLLAYAGPTGLTTSGPNSTLTDMDLKQFYLNHTKFTQAMCLKHRVLCAIVDFSSRFPFAKLTYLLGLSGESNVSAGVHANRNSALDSLGGLH